MNTKILLGVGIFFITALQTKAQIGILTASPNSSLHINGSMAVAYSAISSSATADINSNAYEFTGSAAATLTLPDATTCKGRNYWIKNTSSVAATLTVVPASGQTIDGNNSWTLSETNKAIRIFSNGSNWLVAAESIPGLTNSGTAWARGGNAPVAIQKIGTTSNYDFPLIANNAEVMRISNAGNVGIGSSTFNGTYPEKLLVNAGNTSSVNVISGKGSYNSYFQLNIQNLFDGNSSSDVVATADDGTEIANYIDLGINSSGNTVSGVLGGKHIGYLFANGGDFVMGNATDAKDVIFFTTVTGTNTERMRITSAGLIPGADNTYTFGGSSNRWTAVWSANGTIQTSDYRLKKNILPLEYGLKELMQLKPVSYNWKDNSGSAKVGLIAQEVKKIIPEVVVGDESIENLGMNYPEMVPVLVNAIKDLQQELTDMKTKIQILQVKKAVSQGNTALSTSIK